MNLDQITTKCWILALFERDDGERLLLGDGWFDFKDSLQHFQPNTFANDVIELQGSDGQMLAGQVRRGAPQSFDGYIGDPITNRQTIEQLRREFLMFFRKRHHYKVVYIFPDGTAIQRKQGYITDAPSVPEIRQKFPEYHVALNFEDVNYYEYAENAQGEEIFSNIRNINISTAATGGLVWDNLGAVSDQMGWKDIATATGQMLTMTNPESIKAPIASFEMTGNIEQAIYTGKNLFNATGGTTTVNGVTFTKNADGTYKATGTSTGFIAYTIGKVTFTSATSVTYSGCPAGGSMSTYSLNLQKDDGAVWLIDETGSGKTATLEANKAYSVRLVIRTGVTVNNIIYEPMVRLSSISDSSYEPYVGGQPSPSPTFPQPIETVTGRQTIMTTGKNLFDKNGQLTVGSISPEGAINTSATTYTVTDYISIIGGTTYTTSGMSASGYNPSRCYYDGGKNVISAVRHNSATPFTNTAPSNAVYMRDCFLTADIDSIQIEAGSTATSYEAYTEQSFTIDLGSTELAKIGTYQDRIYKENGKWWLEKQTEKVVLNGSEDWHKSSNTQVDRYWYNIYSGDVVPSFHQIYSDKFFYEYNVPTVNAMWVDVYQTLERLFVNYAPYNTTTVTDLKTWLASNPTTVYYPLATPTTTEITNEEILEGLNSAAGLKLFPGQNNITDQTPNAQPTMTVQYYTALGPGGGLVWESGEAGGATIIEASGLDSAFPLWTVPGPSTNPTLTNITTGQSITWQGTVPAGQTLEIDMDKQTATLAGANVYAFVSGDWIRIDPGPNRMTYVGTGATQASTLSWNNIVG